MRRKAKKPNRIPDYVPPAAPCVQCGVREAHFVPPSLGESGFFICAGSPQAAAAITRGPVEGFAGDANIAGDADVC